MGVIHARQILISRTTQSPTSICKSKYVVRDINIVQTTPYTQQGVSEPAEVSSRHQLC